MLSQELVEAMQKVFRRTALAQRQAARVKKRADDYKEWVDRKVRTRELREARKIRKQPIRDALKRQREEWQLGSLAPRGDVGSQTLKYGAIMPQYVTFDDVPEEKRIKYWNLAKGDRVVLLTGPDKGKIGIIQSTDKTKESVIVKGKNAVRFPAQIGPC